MSNETKKVEKVEEVKVNDLALKLLGAAATVEEKEEFISCDITITVEDYLIDENDPTKVQLQCFPIDEDGNEEKKTVKITTETDLTSEIVEKNFMGKTFIINGAEIYETTEKNPMTNKVDSRKERYGAQRSDMKEINSDIVWDINKYTTNPFRVSSVGAVKDNKGKVKAYTISSKNRVPGKGTQFVKFLLPNKGKNGSLTMEQLSNLKGQTIILQYIEILLNVDRNDFKYKINDIFGSFRK